MKLSILICTIESRAEKFENLCNVLADQIQDYGDVEVLHDLDNGEKMIGQKRNDLVARASGEYLCFIDDDDEISDTYIKDILHAIESKPDCVAFKLEYFEDGKHKGTAHHSLKYLAWANRHVEYGKMFYERTPNHLNPIRSDLAKLVKFPASNFGEDHSWSSQIRQYLKTEQEITKPMYFYKYKIGKRR